MKIRRVKINNFKTFHDVDVELGDYSIIIGANSSGKSNFLNVFQFMRDIFSEGIDNAISMQGGGEYVTNINSNEGLVTISFIIEVEKHENVYLYSSKKIDNKPIFLVPDEIEYELKIFIYKIRNDYRIVNENIRFSGSISSSDNIRDIKNDIYKLGIGDFIIRRTKKKLFYKLINNSKINMDKEDFIKPLFYLRNEELSLNEKELLVKYRVMSYPFLYITAAFSDIKIYNIDTKLPRRSVLITGKNELEIDGSNLALVLKKILENTDDKNKFRNIIKDVLPFVDDLSIERFLDKSLMASLKETYSSKKYIPASLISDGTINIIALIILIYFDDSDIIFIEEPERSIHPKLISNIINMIKEKCINKQIIMTTHNPEFLRHSELQNIIYITRDKKGLSLVRKASEIEELKIQLSYDMGIDFIFIKDLLR